MLIRLFYALELVYREMLYSIQSNLTILDLATWAFSAFLDMICEYTAPINYKVPQRTREP